jgi:undecaprenyl pyrophosphate phosphatase UppP
MNRLAIYIYVLAMPVIAGALVTGVLTVRDYNPMWLLYAAIAGAIAAVPVAMVVSREITRYQKG